MKGNAGFLFYKDYYEDENFDWEVLENNSDIFKRKSEKILKLSFEDSDKNINKLGESFQLKTTYPGLVIGTGYLHETGVEEEFKIGFHFDYTTGLPVIPGSSIKGAIRSAFPGRSTLYKKEKSEYIKNILSKDDDFDVEKLENEIFEGIKNIDAKKEKDKYLPINKRDIFHDAFPISTGNDRLFKDDFLAPHGDNQLKNPIPLKFLKVSPDVTFNFVFDIKPGMITKKEKLNLFLTILLDLGIGAKTNVGYGKFDRSDFDIQRKKLEAEKREKQKQERIEERKKKLKTMSKIDREIAEIEDSGLIENKVMDFFKKIDGFEEKDQIKAALFVKEYFINNNKWENNSKIKSKSKQVKQFKKIQKIKSILNKNN